MRKKIVAGNWKMHKNAEQTEELLSELIAKIPAQTTAQVIVAPTFVNLQAAVSKLKNTMCKYIKIHIHSNVFKPIFLSNILGFMFLIAN